MSPVLKYAWCWPLWHVRGSQSSASGYPESQEPFEETWLALLLVPRDTESALCAGLEALVCKRIVTESVGHVFFSISDWATNTGSDWLWGENLETWFQIPPQKKCLSNLDRLPESMCNLGCRWMDGNYPIVFNTLSYLAEWLGRICHGLHSPRNMFLSQDFFD